MLQLQTRISFSWQLEFTGPCVCRRKKESRRCQPKKPTIRGNSGSIEAKVLAYARALVASPFVRIIVSFLVAQTTLINTADSQAHRERRGTPKASRIHGTLVITPAAK